MRYILSLLIAVGSIHYATAQTPVNFPDDFKLGVRFFAGLKDVHLTPEMKQEYGLEGSKGVTSDPQLMQAMSKIPTDNSAVQAYYEIYQGIDDKSDDAGIIAMEFVSEDALKNAYPYLQFQSNVAILEKDKYLLLIWSDESRKSEQTLQRISNHFIKKLNAKVVDLPKSTKEAKVEPMP